MGFCVQIISPAIWPQWYGYSWELVPWKARLVHRPGGRRPAGVPLAHGSPHSRLLTAESGVYFGDYSFLLPAVLSPPALHISSHSPMTLDWGLALRGAAPNERSACAPTNPAPRLEEEMLP